MYALLVSATGLFSLQFLLKKYFRKREGADLRSTLQFSMYSGIFGCLLMLICKGFQPQWSWFSVAVAAVYAVNLLLYTYGSMKALSVANLSAFSIYAMLGGMLLPFLFGILRYGEAVTLTKLLCVLLIALAVSLTFEKGRQKKGAWVYYVSVFLLNGMSGVISKYHQADPRAVDSHSFMLAAYLVTILITLCWQLLRFGSLARISRRSLVLTGGSALCSGFGNLFCLIALTVLPASVQYPIITGGVIFLSAVIGFFDGETLTIRKGISIITAVGASVIIAL